MSTRLCIKGLAKAVTEEDLKTLFSQRGEVTDVRIARNSQGKSRQFAFVGFRSHEQAQDALSYFDGSYIKTARMSIDYAKKIGDPSLATVWSKKAKIKTSASVKGSEDLEDKGHSPTVISSGNLDRQKAEFLQVMKPRRESKFWANDDGTGAVSSETEQDVKNSTVSEHVPDVTDKNVDTEDGAGTELPTPPAMSAPLSDMDYLRTKITMQIDSDDESEGGQTTDINQEHTENNKAFKEQAHGDVHETQNTQTGEDDNIANDRLFVRNLPFTCTEDELRELFQSYGEMTELHMPLTDEKRAKGFAFVQFLIPENACKALESLDGTSFQGRLIHIVYANKPLKRKREEAVAEEKVDYKTKKELARRQKAMDSVGWNASFVRSDAVVDTLADRYGVSKADILDTEEGAGEMAVRLALGETRLVRENVEYFAQHGVDMSVLESQSSNPEKMKRSTSVILVKNLPSDTESQELVALFARYGTLSQLLLPPSKSVAMVCYVEPLEARVAFKALAYRKYRHVPMYLEWAPLGVIKIHPQGATQNSSANTDTTPGDTVDDDDMLEYSTLYVKNLSFETTETHLRGLVERKAPTGLRAVAIPTKEKNGSKLSMGYGFLEYDTHTHAQEAIASLQGAHLDGHVLSLKPSNKRLTAPTSASVSTRGTSAKATCKLLVRNVAFQATVKEIRQLFESFGQVKKIRMPKKFDGHHRGFAFVEFITKKEAQAAMTALANTHLYGRHLVLEWAKDEEEDIDALREKAASSLAADAGSGRKKRKSDDYGDELEGL